jgi:hypothetical protein
MLKILLSGISLKFLIFSNGIQLIPINTIKEKYIKPNYTILLKLKIIVIFLMNEDEFEDENEDDISLEEERKKLKEMGVNSTWDILTTGEKKRKEPEKKEFRGFN